MLRNAQVYLWDAASYHQEQIIVNHIAPDQNSQSSSTDFTAQSNFSRSVLEKNFSIGTLNFFEKTTVSRGSM